MDRNFDLHRSELESLHRSRGEIERQIKEKRDTLLKGLPRTLGLETIDELIHSLARFASIELRARIGNTSGAKPSTTPKRGERYGMEARARVRRDLEAGKTIAAVARAHGLSTGTVIAWKRSFGLVTPKAASHAANGNGSHADLGGSPNAAADAAQ